MSKEFYSLNLSAKTTTIMTIVTEMMATFPPHEGASGFDVLAVVAAASACSSLLFAAG